MKIISPSIAACEPLGEAFVSALRELGEVTYQPDAWQRPDSIAMIAVRAHALVTRTHTRITAALLDRLPELRVVAVYGAGREHLDHEAVAARGIRLLRCSSAVANTMAEFTLGLTLGLLRRIPEAMLATRAGLWDHRQFIGHDLASRRVAVIGCGPIGERVASLFSMLGAEVMVVRRGTQALPAPLVESHCRLVQLEEALTRSDVLSLHVPGGQGTQGLIGARELAMMPPGGYLINTSRGTVVDLDEVVSALTRDHLAGAALDVVASEPPKFLPTHPRLWFTPHLALYSEEAVQRRIQNVINQLREALHG